ncbi:potassium channel family protein [Anianabacter salinae]|uniref:potassium channel family protein n=1 Tax=Anianabacter salinae TaxID=2851023 RepID=UPI00225E0A3B|nr:TrkA family potassium uptake protein [Anianabacter salinae]MBV0913067.1 TrkA family potassium uptake protein [Anianabacter salinae]
MTDLKKRTFAVIGLGNFGATVAKELYRFGNEVIGIDLNETIVANIAEDISQAIVADARDDEALREAGVGGADIALVSMADDLESSVLSVVNLKLLGVKTVWAKAESKTHHRILSKLGVDRVIHPEVEMGRHTSQVLHNPLIRDYVSLGNGYHVVNLEVPDKLEGKKVSDLNLVDKHNVRCIGVMRGSEWIGASDCPRPLEPDDRLLLLGQRQALREFASSL